MKLTNVQLFNIKEDYRYFSDIKKRFKSTPKEFRGALKTKLNDMMFKSRPTGKDFWTGLITEKSYDRALKMLEGESFGKSPITDEHKVTFTSFCWFILQKEEIISEERYIEMYLKVCEYNYCISEENDELKDTEQKHSFEYRLNNWKTIYKEQGIRLIEVPKKSFGKKGFNKSFLKKNGLPPKNFVEMV